MYGCHVSRHLWGKGEVFAYSKPACTFSGLLAHSGDHLVCTRQLNTCSAHPSDVSWKLSLICIRRRRRICINTYVYMYTCVFVYMCICINTYVYVYVVCIMYYVFRIMFCVSMYMYICIYVCKQMSTQEGAWENGGWGVFGMYLHYWLAVMELKLSYQHPEALLFVIYLYDGTLN